MSLLSRFTAKVFGSTANANRIGEFGSLAEGSPVAYSGTTATPAETQALSNYAEGLDGCVVGAGSVPIQDLNAVLFTNSYQTAYLLQQGIGAWDSGTEYGSNALCMGSTGIVYQCVTASSTGDAPPGSTWAIFLPSQTPVYTVSSSLSGTGSPGSTLTIGSVAIAVASGRSVQIGLQSDTTGSPGYLNLQAKNTAEQTIGGSVNILRGGTLISSIALGLNQAATTTGNTLLISYPPASISFFDASPGTGSLTYTIQVAANTLSYIEYADIVIVARQI